MNIDYWGDSSYYLQGRLDLMTDNMLMGALLVSDQSDVVSGISCRFLGDGGYSGLFPWHYSADAFVDV